MRGRPAKTTAQHRLAGTFRADRHGDRLDGVVATGTPERPPCGELDDTAIWLWDLVVKCLPTGALGRLDSAVLFGVCRAYSLWLQTERQIDGEADPFERRRLIRTAGILWERFSRNAAKFGMNPSDRARLKAPAGDPILELLLSGRAI